MRTILKIKFGSHLYGTSTSTSDIDVKSIYIPDARNILLQRVVGSISTKRPKSDGEKNFAGEVDEESYSLQKYLGLLAEGQTVATDVLFANTSSHLIPITSEWLEIFANKDRLITRKSSAFVGYCRQQANKYGIKGSRVAAARKALTLLNVALDDLGSTAKLFKLKEEIIHMVHTTEHMAIVPIQQISGEMLPHWEICNRKFSYRASIKNTYDIVKALVDEYGARALQAESQQGVDWKALSHAVRVAKQAVELLTTGNINFPLTYAPHLLKIKKGELPYKRVAEEIEHGLLDVESAAAVSTLRDEPDHKWIDDFVVSTYGQAIRTS